MRECKCGSLMEEVIVSVARKGKVPPYVGAFVVDSLLKLWVCIDPHCQAVKGELI